LAENQQLGIAVKQQNEFDWTATGLENLEQLLTSGPKVINIRGGEPLYNKDLLRVVENLPEHICKNSLLHITTNATRWNSQWQQALSKFRLVRIMLSIDAVEELYEYIRFPGSWPTVVDNVQAMKQCGNMKFLINAVVQNLNILHLDKLIHWSQQQNIHLELDQLYSPDYLSLTNLPDSIKHQAVVQLTNLANSKIPPHLKLFVSNCVTQLEKSTFDPDLWATFEHIVGMRDQLRGKSYKNFFHNS
jgi:molybdenum cofactor biosynthesis enzyme MoaA